MSRRLVTTQVAAPTRPAARDFHAVCASGGRVLAWGGVDDGSVWVLDDGAWTEETSAAFPYASGRAGTVRPDGSLVAVDGFGVRAGAATYSADVFVRGASGGAFQKATVVGETPPGRCFPTLAALPGGSVLVFGGYRRVDGEKQERLGDVWRLELD